MAIGITILPNLKGRISLGNQTMVLAEGKGDTSYPTGGYLLTPAMFGLNQITEVFGYTSAGYLVEYSEATGKLIVKYPSGTATSTLTGTALGTHNHEINQIDDAALVVTANVATLGQLPAAVTYVYASAGTSIGPKALVPNGVAPAAGQVALNMTTGTLTFNATDAITAAKCNYIPRLYGTVNPTTSVSAGTPAGTVAVAAGLATEVGNGTNLSALTVISLIAIGY